MWLARKKIENSVDLLFAFFAWKKTSHNLYTQCLHNNQRQRNQKQHHKSTRKSFLNSKKMLLKYVLVVRVQWEERRRLSQAQLAVKTQKSNNNSQRSWTSKQFQIAKKSPSGWTTTLSCNSQSQSVRFFLQQNIGHARFAWTKNPCYFIRESYARCAVFFFSCAIN